MPWTLYRYILWEVAKVLVLSTIVLVLVISVAAAIKPLSDGLLDAVSLAKFVFYTTPTMLQFVLPMAGAFASTVVFSRMTSSNEVLACSISGLSYRAIALPVIVLGVVLTLGVYTLSNSVVPGFYRMAKHVLAKDLTEVLVRSVQQGRPLLFPKERLIIYADDAAQVEPSPELIRELDTQVPPKMLVMLSRIAVGRLDDRGRVRSDITAERADALLFEVAGQTWMTLRLEKVAQFDPMEGDWIYFEVFEYPPFEIESPFKDDPRFFTWTELRRLVREPAGFDDVRKTKHKLATEIASERLLHEIQTVLADAPGLRPITLTGSGDEMYELFCPIVQRDGQKLALSADDQTPIRLHKFVGSRPALQIKARSGLLWLKMHRSATEPSIFIELSDVQVLDPRRSDVTTEKSTESVKGLRWPEPVFGHIERHDVVQLLTLASEFSSASAVRDARTSLSNQVKELIRHIMAQTSERMATSISCLLVLVLGALLSMRMRGGLPLVIYFWSFLLTAIAIIITRSGERVAINLDYPVTAGLLVIWSGNVVLALAVVLTYWKLAKN